MKSADRDDAMTQVDNIVIAECIACKFRKEIHAGEVDKNDTPMCPRCFNPMVAVSARAKPKRRNGGLTLTDLMVALSIVGIIAAAAIPAIYHWVHKEPEVAPVPVPAIPISTADNWNDDLKRELKVVCIDGFEYYFSSVTGGWRDNSDKSRAVLAPKFDKETALPKRCTAEQEKSQ